MKRFFSNRKRNVVLIILGVMLLLDLVLGLICRRIASSLPDQTAADRWDYNGTDAQVSLFFTVDRMTSVNDIKKLEYTMEKKMSDAGIVTAEAKDDSAIVDTVEIGKKNGENEEKKENEKVRVYNSCYSAQGITTITFEKKNAESIDTIGVDGDFFFFHPMELVSGSYFSPDDVMKDKIVVDEDFAWQLFGSNDIIGQCVQIGGINHYISGVVKRSEGKINEAAGLSKSIVYMSYDSLAKYGEVLSGKTESSGTDTGNAQEGGINCYEVVMPNSVEGIAAKILKESAGLDDKYISVVDNTNRFSFFSIIEIIRNFEKRSMWDKPIYYPYWENIARGWEDIVAVIWLFRIIFKVVAGIIICVLAVIWYRSRTWKARDIVDYLADKKYDIESKRANKRNGID